MTNKSRFLTATLGCSLLILVAAIAQARPEVTIPSHHPYLIAGQKAIQAAWDKVTEAQEHYGKVRPNDRSPFGGHVAEAKRRLEAANAELAAAAEVAEEKKK